MKIFLFLCVLFLIGCSQQNKKEMSVIQPTKQSSQAVEAEPQWHEDRIIPVPGNRGKQQIELSISPTVCQTSCNEVCVTFTNYTSKQLLLGREHYFEFYDKGKWKRIEFHPSGGSVMAFNAIGYELNPNMSLLLYCRLWREMHNYISGKYRVYVPFRINGKKQYRTVEFIIE